MANVKAGAPPPIRKESAFLDYALLFGQVGPLLWPKMHFVIWKLHLEP